jgi:hypothetical protein
MATSRSSVASAVSEITLEQGVLSFILRVPPATGGGKDKNYRISILGGDPIDLEALDPAEMAVHLTEAIDLVQKNLGTQAFDTITFESRLNDSALAKAVVYVQPKPDGQDDEDDQDPQRIFGGNKDDKVFGTQRIFSDELDVLLQRMQQALKARHRRVPIERLIDGAAPISPPPTPTTASCVDAESARASSPSNADKQEHLARLKIKVDKVLSSPERVSASKTDDANDGPWYDAEQSLPSPEPKGS